MPDVAAPAEGRRPRLSRGYRAILFAVLAALIFVLVANARVLAAARGRLAAAEAAPARSVVIVPGNLVGRRGRPSLELAQRLWTALALHRGGRASKIVVSGLTHGDYDEPRAMAAWLFARGVPSADVILDPGGYRTAATIADSLALGARSVLIATQRYHLPRALYLAQAAGIDAVGVPAAPGGWSIFGRLLTETREILARAEVVVEVAWRGVRS